MEALAGSNSSLLPFTFQPAAPASGPPLILIALPGSLPPFLYLGIPLQNLPPSSLRRNASSTVLSIPIIRFTVC
jgi:hypothetical protein